MNTEFETIDLVMNTDFGSCDLKGWSQSGDPNEQPKPPR